MKIIFYMHIHTFQETSFKDCEWYIGRLVALHSFKTIAYTCDEIYKQW
jgi:hypothetical protein